MIIIDAGSTNIKLCRINEGTISKVQNHPGVNPNYMSLDLISKVFEGCFDENDINHTIWYYGTGCASKAGREKIEQGLQNYFNPDKINIASDLLAAARATAINKSGQINILGTGSASCIYENGSIKEIMQNSGYLFGDYGSGYALARNTLQALFEKRLDKEVEDKFLSLLKTSKTELLSNIYSTVQPKSKVAMIAQYLPALKKYPQINQIIETSFNDFIKYQIKLNTNYNSSEQYFCGSIAFHFSAELKKCLTDHSLTAKMICKSPIEELCSYHLTYRQ